MAVSISNEIRSIFKKSNNATLQLIAINVIVFIFIALLDLAKLFNQSLELSATVTSWLSVPSSLNRLIFQPWSVFTYMFMHNGFWHILWNLLYLYWFGSIFQSFLGSRRLVGLYILGGLIGFGFYILSYNIFPAFADQLPSSEMLGASAAVMAVLFAVATKLPDYEIRLILIGSVKMKYIALALLIMDLIFLPHSNSGGHLAHLGGAFCGFIYIKKLDKGQDLTVRINKSIDWLVLSFTNSPPKMKVEHSKPKVKTSAEKHSSKSKKTLANSNVSQAEIDKILDKISDKGYESLTKDEKGKLFRASK